MIHRRSPVMGYLIAAFLIASTLAQNTDPLVVTEVSPPPGAVSELRSITVTFSQAVHDVVAEDLLINNQPVLQVSGSGATYTFTFDEPAFGVVDVSFTGGNGITDFANPPHFFDAADPSAHWTYQLRDRTPPTVLSIVPPAGAVVGALSFITECLRRIGPRWKSRRGLRETKSSRRERSAR